MKFHWHRRAQKATERGVSGRATALVAAGLLVMSLAAAACIGGEPTYYYFQVWNYSTNHYYVRINSTNNKLVGDMAVPPTRIALGTADPEAVQAVVYDRTCSTQLATLALPRGPHGDDIVNGADIVITAAGAISVSATPLGSPTTADPSMGPPEDFSRECLALP
jgi:hypothetical protein